MKAWFLFPLVFLAGLVIGGLQPRGELRKIRTEIEKLKRVERTPPSQDRQLANFLNMLPMESPARNKDAAPAQPLTNGQTAAAAGEAPSGTVARAADPAAPEQTPEERAEAFKARIEQASEAWRLRAELARATFVAKTGFNEGEATDFDVLMKSMNVRLEDLFKQTAAQLKEGEAFTPETGVRLMNGLTESMVLTYDEMDRRLPGTWRQDAGSSFDLVTYVDPSVVAPLIDVQEKLPKPGEMGRRGRGNGPNPFRP
jgi:hypothetical protein